MTIQTCQLYSSQIVPAQNRMIPGDPMEKKMKRKDLSPIVSIYLKNDEYIISISAIP
jgi:hypothetical protein